MSVSSPDEHAPARPAEPAAATAPAIAGTETGEPAPPALSMPAVPGLVVLAPDDAPMCSDGVCL